MYEQKIKAYGDILSLYDEWKEDIKEDGLIDESSIKNAIRAMSISQKFGIPLRGIMQYGTSYTIKDSYDDWTKILLMGEDHGRTISWPDDGRQPENEWLFKISFPTGAYIFGQSCPSKTFRSFFNELKSYSPKYCDTVNKNLYYTEDTAKAVYDNFWDIFKKHKALVDEEMKERRKEQLRKELDKLEESDD